MDELFDDERSLISTMESKLLRHQYRNGLKWGYYDGESGIKNIGIAIPESMLNVESVIGWPEIVVDALDERLDWLGFEGGLVDGDLDALDAALKRSNMRAEFDKARLDALVTGVGFLAITEGNVAEGEPAVVVNAVSPQHATYEWDDRLNRVKSAISLQVGSDGEQITRLYKPNETVVIVKAVDGEEAVTRFEHKRGRCSLVAFENKKRSGDVRGKSELSKPIRNYTDHAIRTKLGMEYNREIYTTPQRWFKNVDPEQLGFEETDSPWEVVHKGYRAAMNRVVVLPPNEEGDKAEPSTGQYQSASPAPYISELEMLSKLVASQAGMPVSQFGFATQNPPSADAIAALEARHVKKAERRQRNFGHTLVYDAAYIIQSILDGSPADLEFVSSLSAKWVPASTPTPAAAADAALKLQPLAAEGSEVLLEKAGFTQVQIQKILQERTVNRTLSLVESLRERRLGIDPAAAELAALSTDDSGEFELETAAEDSSGEDAKIMKAKADALGVLVRSGVKAESAAEIVGIDNADFAPGGPVTWRAPEEA